MPRERRIDSPPEAPTPAGEPHTAGTLPRRASLPTTITSHATCSASRAFNSPISHNRARARDGPKLARFGRITNAPSDQPNIDRLKFPRPGHGGNLGVRCRGGPVASGDSRTARPHLHRADRRSLGGSGARRRSTPPRRRRQRYPVLARRLAAQDAPPGAPVEVIQTEPRRFDRLQARRATSMRIAYSRTPAVSLMSKLSSSRCTSFAAIAFGTPTL